MAGTEQGELLTSRHRRAQLALRAATVRDLTTLWPLFDGSTVSFNSFIDATISLALARYDTSSGLASAYYQQFRTAEGVTGDVVPKLAPKLGAGIIRVALLATGLAGTRRAIGAGQTLDRALDSGLVQAAGAVTRLVMDGGRRTVDDTVQADPKAKGWVRITSGRPCAFCAMLASRGGVYKTERTVAFRAHDHCACTSEPLFEGSKVPERNRELQKLWRQAAGGKDNQLNRFRQALTEQRQAGDTPTT